MDEVDYLLGEAIPIDPWEDEYEVDEDGYPIGTLEDCE